MDTETIVLLLLILAAFAATYALDAPKRRKRKAMPHVTFTPLVVRSERAERDLGEITWRNYR